MKFPEKIGKYSAPLSELQKCGWGKRPAKSNIQTKLAFSSAPLKLFVLHQPFQENWTTRTCLNTICGGWGGMQEVYKDFVEQ
ncbi:MAG: hypothetical protein ABWW66_01305, partial [Archaeoglobaceae archaeon]